MSEFDLVSVDWDTIRLMQAGQFKQETFYLEEHARWILHRARFYGLLLLEDNAIGRPLPQSLSERTFRVSVQGCCAVAKQGSLIDIPNRAQQAVQGLIQARSHTVPLYIGVSRVSRMSEPELYPSVGIGLLQCGGRRRQYHLAIDDSDPNIDWVQVAQFENTPAGLIPDAAFLPECMFISSHAGQWQACQQIQALVGRCLATLEGKASACPSAYLAAAALAASLGLAVRNVDARLHPRAYLDRLVGVLGAQRSQLRVLPRMKLAVYQQTLNVLEDTLGLFASEWALGEAFTWVRACFERLLELYGPLLSSLETQETPRERITTKDSPVVFPEREESSTPPPQTPNRRWINRTKGS